MYQFEKCVLWRFLTWQLLCKWYVTIQDQSLLSVLYTYDSFFNKYVTSWMKNSTLMLLIGWLPPCFRTFFDRNSNFRLLDLSASEHWSPVRICGWYSSFAELLSYEKPSKHAFSELEHKKMLKIVKNVLRQHLTLLFCLLVPILAILNLVTLSL
jgi:hypothetical protein